MNRRGARAGEAKVPIVCRLRVAIASPSAACPRASRARLSRALPRPKARARVLLVGVGDPGDNDAAIDWAAAEAAQRKLSLLLVHSAGWWLQGVAAKVGLIRGQLEDAGRTALDSAVRRASAQAPMLEVQTTLDLDAAPVEALLTRSSDAEMIVLGVHPRLALADVSLSPVITTTVREARRPVVVVPPDVRTVFGAAVGRVVVGVDGSWWSSRALRLAFEEAALWNTGLTGVHTWDASGPGVESLTARDAAEHERDQQQHTALLLAMLDEWRGRYPRVQVKEEVVQGHPGHVLADASKGAHVLVVGSRGHGGFAELVLGSVSSAALLHAHCAVMIAHAVRSDVARAVGRPAGSQQTLGGAAARPSAIGSVRGPVQQMGTVSGLTANVARDADTGRHPEVLRKFSIPRSRTRPVRTRESHDEEAAMHPTRSAVAAGLLLFGMSFLWCLPHFLRPGTRPHGTVWLVIQVLVVATVVFFAAGTWAVFRGLSWWVLPSLLGAVLGAITSILWWSAAASTIGAADAALNALLHLAGSILVAGALLIPTVRADLDGRFRAASTDADSRGHKHGW